MTAVEIWGVPAAVLATLGIISILVRAAMWGRRQTIESAAHRARMEASMQWVEAQMRPNAGKSLVDQVAQLRRDVSMLLAHDDERDTAGKRYGGDSGD